MRLLILAGKGGGDYLALESARRAGIIDYEITGFAAISEHSPALKEYSARGKHDALVLNDFKTYYGTNYIPEEKLTDPNDLYTLLRFIEDDQIFTWAEVDEFCDILFKTKKKSENPGRENAVKFLHEFFGPYFEKVNSEILK